MNDGGPAFSSAMSDPNEGPWLQKGMTLWDYYFGEIMKGAVSNVGATDTDGEYFRQVIIPNSMRIVDLMIEARQKRIEQND